MRTVEPLCCIGHEFKGYPPRREEARTFIQIIFSIDLISFDHDLACYKDGVEYTGKSAVDYLIDYCLDNDKKFPDWYAHTDNTSGKRNIIGAILNYINKVEGKDITNFRYYHNGIVNNKPV